MAKKSSGLAVPPVLPSGVYPWLLVTLLIASAATAYVPLSRTLFPLNYVYDLALVICRSAVAYQILNGAAIAAHVIEACYCLYSGLKLNIASEHLGAWFGSVLVFGGPALITFQKAVDKARARR